MKFHRIFRFIPKKILWLTIVAVVIWNEYLALVLKTWSWSAIDSGGDKIPILIVSDPQLIGYRHEKHVAWLARWDSDRYLRRGFAAAFNAVRPKLVIFLGDLFDEGVDMSSDEFDLTMARFQTIFPQVKDVPTIYIPGDNDIGGEMEPIYDRLVNRFQRYFANTLTQDDLAKFFFELASVNTMASSKVDIIGKTEDSRAKILLTHVPIVRSANRLNNEALASFDPDLVLSAHDHTAEVYVRDRNGALFNRFLLNTKIDFIISSKHPIIEIQNPTCSYRMGVPNMGFGVLTLRKESPATAQYTILWLPGRFTQLFLYILIFFLLGCAGVRRVFANSDVRLRKYNIV